jgi:transposase
VSIASVALANRLNANLVRRWVDAQERSGLPVRPAPSVKSRQTALAAEQFLPITIEPASTVRESITIEVRHGSTTVNVSWPIGAAAECAAWLRTLLR